MWIIDEEKKTALKIKTGTTIINNFKEDQLILQTNSTKIFLTIDEELLVLVPMEKICKIIDSLENFNYMDINQVSDFIEEELVNYIGENYGI